MQRWNWFLAADVSGKWITTHGYAEVEYSERSFEATLRYPDVETPYQHVSGIIEPNGQASATVTSRDVAPFRLSGQVFFGPDLESAQRAKMMLLYRWNYRLGPYIWTKFARSQSLVCRSRR